MTAHLQMQKAVPSLFHLQKHNVHCRSFQFLALQEEGKRKAGSPPSCWRAVAEARWKEPVCHEHSLNHRPGAWEATGSLHFSAVTPWQQGHWPRMESPSRLHLVRDGSASFIFSQNDDSFRVYLHLLFGLHFQGLAVIIKLLGEPPPRTLDCVSVGRPVPR